MGENEFNLNIWIKDIKVQTEEGMASAVKTSLDPDTSSFPEKCQTPSERIAVGIALAITDDDWLDMFIEIADAHLREMEMSSAHDDESMIPYVTTDSGDTIEQVVFDAIDKARKGA